MLFDEFLNLFVLAAELLGHQVLQVHDSVIFGLVLEFELHDLLLHIFDIGIEILDLLVVEITHLLHLVIQELNLVLLKD